MGDRPRGTGRGSETPPVLVEVITYAPTIFFHCQHCEVAFGQTGIGERVHLEQARESLPQDLRAEFAHIADWVHGLLDRHGRRVRVRVIDAASLQGFWKSLRYGTRTYPAVVVDAEERYVGPNLALAELEIERRVAGSGRAEAPGLERGAAPDGSGDGRDEKSEREG